MKTTATRKHVIRTAASPAKQSNTAGSALNAERPARPTKTKGVVLTVGHSTRALTDFVDLLHAHEVTCLVDVRTIPRSLHNPQFNKATLPRALKKAGIAYVHLPGLGGLRHAKPESKNGGWHNASFRGYADYMQTLEFVECLDALIELSTTSRVCIMCAEAVPWRCHRSLIADALLIRGIAVEDIMTLTRRTAHTLTPFAMVSGRTIAYPAQTA